MKRLTGTLATLCLLAGSAFAIPVEDPTAWALLQQQLVQWATQIAEAKLANKWQELNDKYWRSINGRYTQVWKRLPQYGHDTTVNVPVELKTLGWPTRSRLEGLATTRGALRALDEFNQSIQARNIYAHRAKADELQPRMRRNLETIYGEVAVSPKGIVQENIYREAAQILDGAGNSSEAIEESKLNLSEAAHVFEIGLLGNGDRERKRAEIDIQSVRATLINAEIGRLQTRALAQMMLTQGHQIGEMERARFRGTEMNQSGLAGVNYSLRKRVDRGVD